MNAVGAADHTYYGGFSCASLVKRDFWNKDWWNP
jgi:hypothetical protein